MAVVSHCCNARVNSNGTDTYVISTEIVSESCGDGERKSDVAAAKCS